MKRLLLLPAVAIVVGVHLETRLPPPQSVRAPALDSNATPAERGHLVYARYGCATCHGADGKGGFANPNAETEGKIPAVNFVAEGYTRPELREKILEGLATIGRDDPKGPRPPYRMPGWAGQITNQETNDLVEYLFSIYPKTETLKWR